MPTLSDGTKFISAKDVTNGEVVTFLNAGEWVTSTKFKYPDGNFQQQFIIEVEYNNEKRKLTLNKSNRTILVNAWDNVTEKWVGRKAQLNTLVALVSGKKVKVIEVEPVKMEGEDVVNEPPEELGDEVGEEI